MLDGGFRRGVTSAVRKAIRCDVNDPHHERSLVEVKNAIGYMPDVAAVAHDAHRSVGDELCPEPWLVNNPSNPATSTTVSRYQGFSIMETICTARRSTLIFSPVVRDPPSSGIKPPIDCTSTFGAFGAAAPAAQFAGRGGMGTAGPGRGFDRISPVFR